MNKALGSITLAAMSVALLGYAWADSGTATTNLELIVPVANTVSCSSASVTASTPGVQTMEVICLITGNANDFDATGNAFTPATATLTHTDTVTTLSATRQATVTDGGTGVGSVTNITGNAGGFTADLSGTTSWSVKATYQTITTAASKAGTYTSDTITYAWSFI